MQDTASSFNLMQAGRTWHERYHGALLGSKPRDQLKVEPDSHDGSDARFSFGRSNEGLKFEGIWGSSEPPTETLVPYNVVNVVTLTNVSFRDTS